MGETTMQQHEGKTAKALPAVANQPQEPEPSRDAPLCAAWPICIQCGIYIAPPQKPWTVVADEVRSGPLHARCWRAFSRRTLAYPEGREASVND